MTKTSAASGRKEDSRNLECALNKIKIELSKFKDFWRRLIRRFQTKVFDDEVENAPEENRSYTINSNIAIQMQQKCK